MSSRTERYIIAKVEARNELKEQNDIIEGRRLEEHAHQQEIEAALKQEYNESNVRLLSELQENIDQMGIYEKLSEIQELLNPENPDFNSRIFTFSQSSFSRSDDVRAYSGIGFDYCRPENVKFREHFWESKEYPMGHNTMSWRSRNVNRLLFLLYQPNENPDEPIVPPPVYFNTVTLPPFEAEYYDGDGNMPESRFFPEKMDFLVKNIPIRRTLIDRIAGKPSHQLFYGRLRLGEEPLTLVNMESYEEIIDQRLFTFIKPLI